MKSLLQETLKLFDVQLGAILSQYPFPDMDKQSLALFLERVMSSKTSMSPLFESYSIVHLAGLWSCISICRYHINSLGVAFLESIHLATLPVSEPFFCRARAT